jgi:hypothetical protein
MGSVEAQEVRAGAIAARVLAGMSVQLFEIE